MVAPRCLQTGIEAAAVVTLITSPCRAITRRRRLRTIVVHRGPNDATACTATNSGGSVIQAGASTNAVCNHPSLTGELYVFCGDDACSNLCGLLSLSFRQPGSGHASLSLRILLGEILCQVDVMSEQASVEIHGGDPIGDCELTLYERTAVTLRSQNLLARRECSYPARGLLGDVIEQKVDVVCGHAVTRSGEASASPPDTTATHSRRLPR